MSTKDRLDRAPWAPRAKRILFREGQPLLAADLNENRDYSAWMRRFHYAYAHHDWGIVEGLGLKVKDGEVQIFDGGGIDGYGREIVFFGQEPADEASGKDAPLPYRTWSIADITADQEQPPDWIGFWLRYAVAVIEQKNTGGLHNPRLVPSSQLYATFEEPTFPLEEDSPLFGVPPIAGELKPATRGLYLGAIKKTPNAWRLNLHHRRYTRAYAGQIATPDGNVRAELRAADPKCPRRFAVGFRESDGSYLERVTLDNLQPQANTIGDASELAFQGSVHLFSTSSLLPELGLGTRTRGQMLKFESPVMPPSEPAPWHMYRTVIPDASDPDKKRMIHELRVELYDPGKEGYAQANKLSIGIFRQGDNKKDDKAKEQFEPLITVSADGNVVISGLLSADEVVDVIPDAGAGVILQTAEGMEITVSTTEPAKPSVNMQLTMNYTVRNVSLERLTAIVLNPTLVPIFPDATEIPFLPLTAFQLEPDELKSDKFVIPAEHLIRQGEYIFILSGRAMRSASTQVVITSDPFKFNVA